VRGLTAELSDRAGTDGIRGRVWVGRVVLLDAPERFSFATACLTPRVAVSRGLLQGISDEELRAVLEHERYHVCNLDPLKILLVQALSATVLLLAGRWILYAPAM